MYIHTCTCVQITHYAHVYTYVACQVFNIQACIKTVCLHSMIGKDYPIQASTKDEMIVWIKAIEDAAVSITISYFLVQHVKLLSISQQ